MLSFYAKCFKASKKIFTPSRTFDAKENKPLPLSEIAPSYWIKLANTPRSYTLTNIEDEKKSILKKTTILCFGCHGEINAKAEMVAAKLAEVAEKDEILFIVVTGDNFYPKGVQSPNDKKFETFFEKKFLQYPSLKDKCFFIVLGNHDYNYRGFTGINQQSGIAVAAHEVAHTFLNKAGEFDPKKEEYLTQSDLSLQLLKKKHFHWMMPSRFYRVYYPECQTEFFFLDSNTYLSDYLKLQELNGTIQSLEKEKAFLKNEFDRSPIERVIASKKQKRSQNQVHWLNEALRENSETKKIIIQHHPFYTMGKRDLDSDASHYLTEIELAQLEKIFKVFRDESKNINYNELLKTAFEKDELLPLIDVLIHSHDHATALYNSSVFSQDDKLIKKGFCQLNVGGGGGEFQNMKKFSEIRQIPIYSGYGCSSISFEKDNIIFKMYNIQSPDLKDWHSQGKQWCFSNKSMLPVFDWRTFVSEDEKILYLKVRQLILNGCYSYFDAYEQYKKNKNTFVRSMNAKFGHFGREGRNRTLVLMGVLNNPKPISTAEMLTEICDILKGSTLLLEKINQEFYQQKFITMTTTFVTQNFSDFLEKFKRSGLFTHVSSELDSWEMIDAPESYGTAFG